LGKSLWSEPSSCDFEGPQLFWISLPSGNITYRSA
jgi:hypothetical protein